MRWFDAFHRAVRHPVVSGFLLGLFLTIFTTIIIYVSGHIQLALIVCFVGQMVFMFVAMADIIMRVIKRRYLSRSANEKHISV